MTTITVKVNQKPYFDLVAFVQCYKPHLDVTKIYNIDFIYRSINSKYCHSEYFSTRLQSLWMTAQTLLQVFLSCVIYDSS